MLERFTYQVELAHAVAVLPRLIRGFRRSDLPTFQPVRPPAAVLEQRDHPLFRGAKRVCIDIAMNKGAADAAKLGRAGFGIGFDAEEEDFRPASAADWIN